MNANGLVRLLWTRPSKRKPWLVLCLSGGGSSRSPLAIILSMVSGNGRWSADASSHDARIHTSHSFAVVKIISIARSEDRRGQFRAPQMRPQVRLARQPALRRRHSSDAGRDHVCANPDLRTVEHLLASDRCKIARPIGVVTAFGAIESATVLELPNSQTMPTPLTIDVTEVAWLPGLHDTATSLSVQPMRGANASSPAHASRPRNAQRPGGVPR
jgi:hypothetical protein